MRVGLASAAAPGPGRRRGSRAPAARRPAPSALWPPPCCPWRGSPTAGGPMKTRPASAQASAKSSFSRQEAVARMDRLRAGGLRRLEDRVDAQVAVARRRAAPICTASSARRTCARMRVGVGVDGDGARCPCAARCAMTRQAISPRLAIRILVNMRALHPEHAEASSARSAHCSAAASASAEHAPRLRRVDDAVVPQPRAWRSTGGPGARTARRIGALKAASSSAAPGRCPWPRCRRA